MERSISMPVNLDGQVVRTLFISFIVAIALLCLAFRYGDVDFSDAPDISFKPGAHYVGEPIRFSAVTKSMAAKDLVWHIDELKQTESGPVVIHVFPTAGIKRVRLVSGGCLSKDTLIHIIEHPVAKSQQLPAPALRAIISAPSTATVDSPVVFEDRTPGALKWEWIFNVAGSIDAIGRNPTYTFRTPGRKKVSLVVNGNIHGESIIMVRSKAVSTHKPITTNWTNKIVAGVQPIGPPIIPPPPPPPPPPISEIKLGEMLRKVVDGEMHIRDFDGYLCSSNPIILYNGKEMPFADLCNKLRAIRKSRKIKEMIVRRQTDPATSCIKSITVYIDKKIIPRIFDKNQQY